MTTSSKKYSKATIDATNYQSIHHAFRQIMTWGLFSGGHNEHCTFFLDEASGDLVMKVEAIKFVLLTNLETKKLSVGAEVELLLRAVTIKRRGAWGDDRIMEGEALKEFWKGIGTCDTTRSKNIVNSASTPHTRNPYSTYIVSYKDGSKYAESKKKLLMSAEKLAARWGATQAQIDYVTKSCAGVIANSSDEGWELKMLSGPAITFAYYNNIGYQSCMCGVASRFTEFYANNPNTVKLAVAYHKASGQTVRALCWFDNGTIYCDRTYPCGDLVKHNRLHSLLKKHYGEAFEDGYAMHGKPNTREAPVFVMQLPKSRRTAYLDTFVNGIKPDPDNHEVWLSNSIVALAKFAAKQGLKLDPNKDSLYAGAPGWVGGTGILMSAYGQDGGPWAVRRLAPANITEPNIEGMAQRTVDQIMEMADKDYTIPPPVLPTWSKPQETPRPKVEPSAQPEPVPKQPELGPVNAPPEPVPEDNFQLQFQGEQMEADPALVRGLVDFILNDPPEDNHANPDDAAHPVLAAHEAGNAPGVDQENGVPVVPVGRGQPVGGVPVPVLPAAQDPVPGGAEVPAPQPVVVPEAAEGVVVGRAQYPVRGVPDGAVVNLGDGRVLHELGDLRAVAPQPLGADPLNAALREVGAAIRDDALHAVAQQFRNEMRMRREVRALRPPVPARRRGLVPAPRLPVDAPLPVPEADPVPPPAVAEVNAVDEAAARMRAIRLEAEEWCQNHRELGPDHAPEKLRLAVAEIIFETHRQLRNENYKKLQYDAGRQVRQQEIVEVGEDEVVQPLP